MIEDRDLSGVVTTGKRLLEGDIDANIIDANAAHLFDRIEGLEARPKKAGVPPKVKLARRRARRERYRANKSERVSNARNASLGDVGYANWTALGKLLRPTESDAQPPQA